MGQDVFAALNHSTLAGTLFAIGALALLAGFAIDLAFWKPHE